MTSLLQAQVTSFLTAELGRAPTASEISQGMLAPWSLSSIQNSLAVGTSILSIDNTDDIQTAIDQAHSQGGGTVYLKPGTYTQSTSLTGYSSVALVGVSPDATIIDFGNTNHSLSFMGTNVYNTGSITSIVGGVNVTGSGTLWLANASAGQYLFLGTRWYLIAAVTGNTTLILAEAYGDNVTMPAAPYRIATLATDFSVQNLTLKSSTGTALVVQDARRFNISTVLLLQNAIGYTLTNASEAAISQLNSIANSGDGMQWSNVGLCQVSSLNVIGNGGNGITMSNVKTVDISPIAANSNTADGINVTTGVDITMLLQASGNGGQGVELVATNDNIIINTTAVQGNTSDGIKLTATSDNCRIALTSITGNGGYGVNIANANCDDNIIIGNTFAGNSSGAVNDSGTGTLIRSNVGEIDN